MNKTLIKEIFDTDFDRHYKMSDLSKFKIRRAARGIVLHEGKIAVLNVRKYIYRKFPGGGVEQGELIEGAFKREILEEVGCRCEVIDQGGIVIEWRDQFKLLQISYVFLAKVIGELGRNKLTHEEIAEGYQLEWIPAVEIREILMKNTPTDYEGKFITARDISIVDFYKDKIT